MKHKKYIAPALLLAYLVYATVTVAAAFPRYEVSLTVGRDGLVGINPPATDKLDFGEQGRGTRISQSFEVRNSGSREYYTRIIVLGSVSDLLSIKPLSFVLPANETKKIKATVKIPVSAPRKQYSGRILLVRIPKVW